MNKSSKNRKLVVAAMLGAITIALGFTPLGFVPLGLINATTLHIPVIIAGILEGPVVGASVGLIFGLNSLFNAITKPNPMSVVFMNPLISIAPRILIGLVSYYVYHFLSKKDENFLRKASIFIWSIISVAMLYLTYRNVTSGESVVITAVSILFTLIVLALLVYSIKYVKSDFAVVAGAFLGSMTNTVLVLGGIYLLYAETYMEFVNKPIEQARAAILGVAVTSGIPEAILSVIITTAVVTAIKKGGNR